MAGALLCSLLPGLIYYKLAGKLGLAPRYAGPYFIPAPANMKKVSSDLDALRPWFESGQMKTVVSQTYALDELPAALEKLKATGHDGSTKATTASGGFHGKLSVRVAS